MNWKFIQDEMIRHVRQGKGREAREDLTGEHPLGDAGQAILFLIFAAAWTLDSFGVRCTTLNKYLPPGFRIILSLSLIALSGLLVVKGVSTVFGETRKTPAVIRTGVFSCVRHPIYLGEILFCAGLLALSFSIAAFTIWVLLIGFLHFISRHEEKLLINRFGDEYRAYMREVGMWFPKRPKLRS